MRLFESNKIRKEAFPLGRLLSFFVFSGILLFSACKTAELPEDPVSWGEKRAEMQMERIQKERRIVFAVVRDGRGEGSATRLAEKAAAMLGLKMILFRVAQENIPSLLRSGRVDFAWGGFVSEEEIRSCHLMPLTVNGKEAPLYFALPLYGKNWKGMLGDALEAAWKREGENHAKP